MQLINLTRNHLNIFDMDGNCHVLPPSSHQPAAVRCHHHATGELEALGTDFDLFTPEWGEFTGIPDPAPSVFYIVPSLVASKLCRPDVISPGPAIRQGGESLGCRGFVTHNSKGGAK